MVGTCEKMSTSISSSSTNEWPQNQILDDQKSFMASSISANMAMERSIQDPLHRPHKCPRCDSSNTKFCYYNNYSLSQPRHFCKSCKRYWTRGGTLRNVPVGGGCRKNKKVKRQPSNGGGDGISSAAAASTATIKPSVQPDIDLSPTSNSINNPLFYSMPTNPLELNFPFSRFSTTRVSSEFDHQPQINGLGIGFSSGLMISELQNSDYKNGFKQIFQDVNSTTSCPSLLSAADNNLVFFGSSNDLASSLQQQRFVSTGLKDIQASNGFQGLMPYKDMQMLVGNGGVIGKETKIEGENRLEWNQNQIEQINSSDYSSLLWNTNNIGAWFDPSNMGTYSSVPSLI